MFKKPLADIKTIAPLRTSDRRKLRQRVLENFTNLLPEEGDVLVPEGLHSQKFKNYSDEPGVVYYSMEGDPLWFTIGKNSDELIPTVYTLWKRPDLLPFLSTPAAVVPKLIGGADLMIPGVVQFSPSLAQDQLVSITQYHRGKLGYPIAIGRMTVPGETMQAAEESDSKGKAVYVLHTWKDALWVLGANSNGDVPEPRELTNASPGEPSETDGAENLSSEQPETDAPTESPPTGGAESTEDITQPALTAEEVSQYLREALLQTLATTLSALPPSSFPMQASTFWSSYVLPARPADALGPRGLVDAGTLDVKHSTHKSVKTFLKASAKEGLIKLKDAKGGDVLIAAIFPKHPAVVGHSPHKTIHEVEVKIKKAEDGERKEKEAEEKRKSEIQVMQYWKPFGDTIPWFVAAEKETSELYTLLDIKAIFNNYVSSKNLINPQDQQYINVADDAALLGAVSSKNETDIEFLKREEALDRIKEHMQSWYDIKVEGRDVVRKKGQLKPIQAVVKIRQNRKGCTLVTGFEPFLLNADGLAEELRKLCASSTSVSTLPGKGTELAVMVQGKQIKAVTDLLLAKGVPKEWIKSADLTAGKKK